jgi:hypothetical protein
MSLVITKENYFSLEANRECMGFSQFKDWQGCEAKAKAKYVTGLWAEEPSEAMLIGSYVHAAIESKEAFEKFKEDNPSIFKKDGNPKTGFIHAEKMIDTLRSCPICIDYLSGGHEQIFTAEFAGAMWKIMIDVHAPDKGRFIDLKTTRSIRDLVKVERLGFDGRKEFAGMDSFIECYNYWMQFAIYAEIERLAVGREEPLKPHMVVVSKEKVPDREVFKFYDMQRLTDELDNIRLYMPRIIDIKNGDVEPKSCGMCDYCRSTKIITEPIWPDQLT